MPTNIFKVRSTQVRAFDDGALAALVLLNPKVIIFMSEINKKKRKNNMPFRQKEILV